MIHTDEGSTDVSAADGCGLVMAGVLARIVVGGVWIVAAWLKLPDPDAAVDERTRSVPGIARGAVRRAARENSEGPSDAVLVNLAASAGADEASVASCQSGDTFAGWVSAANEQASKDGISYADIPRRRHAADIYFCRSRRGCSGVPGRRRRGELTIVTSATYSAACSTHLWFLGVRGRGETAVPESQEVGGGQRT